MKTGKKSKFKKIKSTIPVVDEKTKKEVARILQKNMRCNMEGGNNWLLLRESKCLSR